MKELQLRNKADKKHKDKKKIRTYRDVVLQKANINRNFRAEGTFRIIPPLLHLFCLNSYIFVTALVNAEVS